MAPAGFGDGDPDQELPRLGLPDSRNATQKLISGKVELRSELRMSWDTLLPSPIPVPGSKPLVTLRDAGMLIQKLPKSQANLPAWRTATEALMLAAEERRPLMHADVGLGKALHPRGPVYDMSRKDPPWGRCKLARDR